MVQVFHFLFFCWSHGIYNETLFEKLFLWLVKDMKMVIRVVYKVHKWQAGFSSWNHFHSSIISQRTLDKPFPINVKLRSDRCNLFRIVGVQQYSSLSRPILFCNWIFLPSGNWQHVNNSLVNSKLVLHQSALSQPLTQRTCLEINLNSHCLQHFNLQSLSAFIKPEKMQISCQSIHQNRKSYLVSILVYELFL